MINNELFGETEQFQQSFLIRYFSFITYEIKPQNGQRHPLLQKAERDRKKCRTCGLHGLCGDIIYALTIHCNNTDMQSIYGQSTAPLVPSFNRRRWLKWDLWEDTEQIQTPAVGGIVYRLHLEGLTICKWRQSLVGLTRMQLVELVTGPVSFVSTLFTGLRWSSIEAWWQERVLWCTLEWFSSNCEGTFNSPSCFRTERREFRRQGKRKKLENYENAPEYLHPSSVFF